MERIAYDEFGLFHENASDYGLPIGAPPSVRRRSVDVASGRTVSVLQWGEAAPELVVVHGGAQNAHTWDTVLLALGLPALAPDLPGHGHSGWTADGVYTPQSHADDLAVAIEELAPEAARSGGLVTVGMSLGGLSSMQLAVRHPHLVRSLMLVDVTPGVNRQKAKAITDFVDGPQTFPDFASLLARTMEHNPTRRERSLRRGILHNAHQLADGSWRWNYDRRHHSRSSGPGVDKTAAQMNPMWADFAAVACPMVLVRGSLSPVVDDGDVAEALRRQPGLDVRVVDGAGHSVQGDRPLELAALIGEMIG